MLKLSHSWLPRLAGGTALAAAAVLPLTLSTPAHAWGVAIGIPAPVIVAPPVVVAPPVYAAPPPVYAAPPVAYAAPYPYAYYGPRVWVAPGWYGGHWYAGHWRYR